MAGNTSDQDRVQDMRDGWIDGSCSELLRNIFGGFAMIVLGLAVLLVS